MHQPSESVTSSTLQNFSQLLNHTKNMHWQRCCATGMCDMRQSQSTHCNSGGYDYSILQPATRHIEMLQRL